MKKFGLLVQCVTFSVCLQAAQLPVTLGSASTFTVLAGSTVTNTGPSAINGDVGLSPGSAVAGFPPGSVVNGAIHVADGPAGLAQGALTAAFIDAAGRTLPATVAGDLGGLTLAPGLYKSTSSLGITGNLTLDGQGNANSVFIFQVGSALTTAPGSRVILIGGAQAANIFWQVGSSATLDTTSVFNGTIMAQASVTLKTGAVLIGRALARTGAVTLDSNSAVNPGPPTSGGAVTVTCPLSPAPLGIAYASFLAATGGTAPYTFSTTGALPPGLSLNTSTGAITGTPTTAGSTSFTGNALDSASVSGTNSCNITVTATNQADVSIVKSGPASAAPSTNITFNLAVANAGPNFATGVTVTDILPAGTTFVSAAPTQGSCSGTTTVTCSMGTMAVGSSASVVLVLMGPNAAGSVVNTASVSSATPDSNPENNASRATVTITGSQADVSITKSGPATAAPNTNMTFNLAVANAGPISAAGVTVTDVLPAGTTFVSATPSQGTCSGTSTVICSLGTVATGGSATVVIVVVSPNAAGPVVNTASVSSTTPDPNLANNTSTVTVAMAVGVPALSTWSFGLLALLLAWCSVRFLKKAHA